jgi:diadenosine tetraphosphate (Ap4A) HIT family hydrolase
MTDCDACDLATGSRPLPGGMIHATDHWRVEHCIGPLGLGALIVKPTRHVTAIGALTDDEASELGPLLRLASDVAGRLVAAEQVYNCLWSHAHGQPGHIHYVVQPVTQAQKVRFGAHGPALQMAMFSEGETPTDEEIERVARRARELIAMRARGL